MTASDIKTSWIELNVDDGTSMRAYCARPEGPAKAGLLVFQEAFGVNAHIRNVTERFASKGFLALAPELFHRTGEGFEGNYGDFEGVRPHISALTNEGLSADLTSAYRWMEKEQGERIACVGYCMGGRTSFLASLVLPLKCAVSYYGGGIAPNQMNKGLLGRTAEVKCPILLFWGGLDKHILPEHYHAVEASLKENNKDYVQVVMSKADHGFNCDARPSYNPIASKEALALTLAFFEEHLG